MDQVIDEVQQLLIRPMQILDHQHCRTGGGQRLDESSPRRERLGSVITHTVAPTPTRRLRWPFTQAASAGSGTSPATACASLLSVIADESLSSTPAWA